MKLALFDLDGTLLPIDSDHAFGEFLVASGWADGDAYRRRNDEFFAQYRAETLDIDAYVDFCTAAWRMRPAQEVQALQKRFVEEVARPALRPAAQALVQRHREAGDLMAIVTATNDFVTRPFAQLLGVPTLIATELERDEAGRPTGAIRGTPAFRAGKIERVHDWLRSIGRDFGDFDGQVFYSDSTNDLALLEHVSDPVATNPSPALEAVARQRRWPILRLFP
ncbi:MAG: phosphoserine phosphatase [Rubrivivax sp. SCN 71-131]|jgi:HAD superfamily hydrolase (TIGR01490 family)|nr:MAG: phosphoserine phosphatase [Rubrivivax sp. SCN 71-131]